MNVLKFCKISGRNADRRIFRNVPIKRSDAEIDPAVPRIVKTDITLPMMSYIFLKYGKSVPVGIHF